MKTCNNQQNTTITLENLEDGSLRAVLFIPDSELRRLGWSCKDVFYCRLTRERVEWVHTLSHRKGWPGCVTGIPYKNGAKWFYFFNFEEGGLYV